MADIDRFFDPSAPVQGCSEGDLAALEQLFRRPLPQDYVHLVTRYAGYNESLLDGQGAEVMQYRIATREKIERERAGYAVFEMEFPDGLPIGGQDAWRLVLAPHDDGAGSRYLDVDLGSGDVLGEYDTLEAFFAEQVAP